MSDNKFTESMEVEAVGNLKPGDIGWGTCDGCEKNIHKFPGVLLQGVTQEAAKLLYEKVEIVAEGTKAKMAELEASNKQLREIICEFSHYLACPAYGLRPGTTKTIIDIAAEGRAGR